MGRNSIQGITLVELLIAVSVFAFIVASSYLLLRSFNKTYSRGVSQAVIRQERRLLLRVFGKDISSMYLRCRADSKYKLDFYSLIMRGDTNHLSEVHYRFEKGSLYRGFELDSDEDLTTTGREEALTSNLKSLEFRFLSNNTWLESWKQEGVPEAVKVHLEWREGHNMDMVFDVMGSK